MSRSFVAPFLTVRGYRILRVTNHDVLANLPGVLQMLAEEMKP